MVVAELRYEGHYDDQHQAIVDCLLDVFPDMQNGHQGDSWIWIGEDHNRISIDTFYSMTHQVKAADPNNPLLEQVLVKLQSSFEVDVFNTPEAEPHED